MLLLIVILPVTAQENDGFIIYRGSIAEGTRGNFHGSQLYCSSSDCWFVRDNMYITLLGVDHEIGWYAPNQPGALAQDWTISDDFRTITINLRDDLFWSDGTPITSDDVMITIELYQNADANPAGEDGLRYFNDLIQEVVALDERTVQFTFNQGSCDMLTDLDAVHVMPAHIYRDLIDEVGYAELRNHEWFDNPTVVSGVFQWGSMSEDGTITLLPSESYADARMGQVQSEGIIQLTRSAEPEPRRAEWFLDSQETVWGNVSPDVIPSYLEMADRGELQLYEYPQNQIAIMGLNLADPTNPQPAIDEAGNLIDQGYHPLFGDRITRQAMAHAVNIQPILDGYLNGLGYPLPSLTIPASWAYNLNLDPISYDPTVALELFAQSGWVPENPNEPASQDNPLICQDCLYAREVDSDFNGTPFEFVLLAAASGELGATATVFQQQLMDIGIEVTLDSENYWTFTQQTFDAVLVSLTGGYPYVASTKVWFDPLQDLQENQLNFTSFYNEAYLALEETALTVPGCGLTERANIYHQIQQILQEEQPFLFLYSKVAVDVAKNELENFAPYPNDITWNIDTWRVIGDE